MTYQDEHQELREISFHTETQDNLIDLASATTTVTIDGVELMDESELSFLLAGHQGKSYELEICEPNDRACEERNAAVLLQMSRAGLDLTED